MTTIARYAEEYVKAGLSVIPLKPKSKEPILSSWAQFQKRRPTSEEIQTWFRSGQENIGIVTGALSNLAVIDMDGAQGISEGSKLQMSSPVTVLSGGNGKHLWFKCSDNLRNSASKLAPKVDIRGEGGYIVAPPSIHPSGRRYRFLNNAVVNAGFLSRLPSFPVAVFSATPVTTDITTIEKQEDWISEALEEMKNGHVHNTLISVLGKFRYHGFSVSDTFKLLQPYAYEDGQPYEGLREKIEELWSRYPAGSVSVPVHMAKAPQTSEPLNIEGFLENEVKTEWFCSPFFSRQSLAFIVGLPESLKSWLAIDLAIELARGGHWLGKFPTKTSRVLYIDQERALPETQRRYKSLLAEKGLSKKDIAGNLFVDCSSHRKMDLDVSYEAFKAEVSKIRPDVIIIDSFVTFHTKDENSRMEVQKVLDRLKAIREQFNCSTIFINHENKNAYQDATDHSEPSAGRMVGSIGVVAAAESILTVKKIDKESSNVYQTKNSLASPADSFTVKITDTKDGIRIGAI